MWILSDSFKTAKKSLSYFFSLDLHSLWAVSKIYVLSDGKI